MHKAQKINYDNKHKLEKSGYKYPNGLQCYIARMFPILFKNGIDLFQHFTEHQ